MILARSVLAAAAMALACGAAFADDNKRQLRDFNELDKNGDGKLSRSEAARNRELLSKWIELDRDADGSVSRTEYLREMARQDTNKVQERMSGATQSKKGSASDNAATTQSKKGSASDNAATTQSKKGSASDNAATTQSKKGSASDNAATGSTAPQSQRK